MKERPIQFSDEMVRAILDGRKSMTRRVVTVPKGLDLETVVSATAINDDGPARLVLNRGGRSAVVRFCPFGAVGDRLWVRERWSCVYLKHPVAEVEYRADGDRLDRPMVPNDISAARWVAKPGWAPSIHMPRWASRLTLELLDVRVERVQGISEPDAKAEGLTRITKDGGRTWKFGIPDRDGLPGTDDLGWPWVDWRTDPRHAFAHLWDSLHAGKPGSSWADNPWVWALTFRRLP